MPLVARHKFKIETFIQIDCHWRLLALILVFMNESDKRSHQNLVGRHIKINN